MSDEVSAHVTEAHRAAEESLPFDDTRDEENARRGLIAPLASQLVTSESGDTVWDGDAYSFLEGDNPGTVHPSLWRQSRLVQVSGLFEVVPGVYQVRGLDLSVISFIEGTEGVVVVDPLISTETAAAALALYREHRGDKRVTAVIYTHSHADHFAGVKGVTTQEDVDAGRCQVIAPAGFLEEAVAENVYAGTAMSRRAGYMYGAALAKGPNGQVGTGLGQTTSVHGTVTLIAPTMDITATGQEEVLDGVRFVFQLTPGTEAPSEMNFFLPDHAALCMAENATHTLHNLLTLRGALVRDPHVWSQYLTESIDLFAHQSDVVFSSHHWPTWGREELVGFLSEQRDMYAYLHDQTLRMLNQGLVGAEIAEAIELPPALERAWSTRGYYGSVSHNVKAIYQRYMGWFDGNPAHLWEHPPVEAAKRYVDLAGGADAAIANARASHESGDLRWAVTVLNHVLFADPDNAEARELQAAAFTQLAYGSENGTWRNFFLSGATELRDGNFGTPAASSSPDILGALTVEQTLDALAVRIYGPAAWHDQIRVDFTIDETTYRVSLANGVLTYSSIATAAGSDPDVTLTADRAAFQQAMFAPHSFADLVSSGRLQVDGDPSVLDTLISRLDAPDPAFDIVLP